MKKFPAAFKSKDGKPLLSWRVAILPVSESGAAVHAQFHLDEPWDSEHNKQFIAKMPDVYRDPLSENEAGYTVYLTPRGENTAVSRAQGRWDSRICRTALRTRSHSSKVRDDYAVPWTKPDDWNFDPDEPTAELGAITRGLSRRTLRRVSSLYREQHRSSDPQRDVHARRSRAREVAPVKRATSPVTARATPSQPARSGARGARRRAAAGSGRSCRCGRG